MSRSSTSPSSAALTPQSEAEALVVKHALALYRDAQRYAKDAPYGQFLTYAEAAVIDEGRKFLQTSLQTLAQEEINAVEKKNETRLCPTGQRKRRHRGHRSKDIETAAGPIKVKRRYDECLPCKQPGCTVDALLGLEIRYTVGLRSLAVFAGTNNSFVSAEKQLTVYRGLDLSSMTIRELCQQEAPKMAEWIETSSEVHKEFIAAPGVSETTLDGAFVNTLNGWSEVKVGINSKRTQGVSALPEEWETRHLPEVESRIAFAAVENAAQCQKRMNDWRRRLHLGADSDISALGDGAAWIWNNYRETYGKVRECLDIFHALEHVSATGKVLYGEGTEAYEQWRKETTMELLSSGFTLLEGRLERLDTKERTDTEKESLRKLRGYLSSHRERLCYRERLAQGRAIGSGQIEGACKNLIGRRLKQTGARWDVSRLNRMASLCAVQYSGQWEKYWTQAK